MKQSVDTKKKDILDELSRLCKDLQYISETDAPVEVLDGEGMKDTSTKELLAHLKVGSSEPTLEGPIEDFFEKLSTAKEWHNAKQKAKARRFKRIFQLFRKELLATRMIRIGKIRIEIFVIGLDEDGRVIGIRTKAVET